MPAKHSFSYTVTLPHMSIEVPKEEDLVGLRDPLESLIQSLTSVSDGRVGAYTL